MCLYAFDKSQFVLVKLYLLLYTNKGRLLRHEIAIIVLKCVNELPKFMLNLAQLQEKCCSKIA